MLLTLVGAVALVGARWRGKAGVLGRRRWFGVLLLGVAGVDALVAVVPLLVQDCFLLGRASGWEVWSWLAGVGCFPLTVVVYGSTWAIWTLLVYHVRVTFGGLLLGEWVSPWLEIGSMESAAWLAAAVLPVVVTMDLLVAVGAFVVVVVVDWVRGRVQPQKSKGGFSPVALRSEAPT